MLRTLTRGYWAILPVAILAAFLGFVGSFAVSPAYQAHTHLIVRARDTSLLSGTGSQSDPTSPSLVSTDLAKALSDTQSALVTSNQIPTMVVDKLALDKQKTPHGVVASLKSGLSSVYHHLRAWVTYGHYPKASKHTLAVAAVANGLSATQVSDSYVIDLAAKAGTPKQAAAIANAAAEALVQVSAQRSDVDSARYRDFLQKQLTDSAAADRRAARALSDYRSAHGISGSSSSSVALSSQSKSAVQQQLQQAQVQLTQAQGQLADLQRTLTSLSASSTSKQNIVTGRSSTSVSTSQSNPLYTQLATQRDTASAEVAGLRAKVASLQAALSDAKGSSRPVNATQVTLGQLQLAADSADANYKSLSAQYNSAVLNAASDLVDVSRIDTAKPPLFPVSPIRYMYMLIAALVGAILSFVIIHRRRLRSEAASTPPSAGPGSHRMIVDLSEEDAPLLRLRSGRTIDLGAAVPVTIGGPADAAAANGYSLNREATEVDEPVAAPEVPTQRRTSRPARDAARNRPRGGAASAAESTP